MRRTIAARIVLVSFPFWLFPQQRPESSHLRQRIPIANPSSYRDVRDAIDWKYPYLIVQSDGIEVRTTGAARTGPTMPVQSVIPFLEKLPRAAWPYGLVVGVQENGIRSGDDGARINGNTTSLLNQLRKFGVKAYQYPTG
jgi:hypothetical protein